MRCTEKKHFKNDKRCLSALKQVFHNRQRTQMKSKGGLLFYGGFCVKADLFHSLYNKQAIKYIHGKKWASLWINIEKEKVHSLRRIFVMRYEREGDENRKIENALVVVSRNKKGKQGSKCALFTSILFKRNTAQRHSTATMIEVVISSSQGWFQRH